jgi:hypothetical protein
MRGRRVADRGSSRLQLRNVAIDRDYIRERLLLLMRNTKTNSIRDDIELSALRTANLYEPAFISEQKDIVGYETYSVAVSGYMKS